MTVRDNYIPFDDGEAELREEFIQNLSDHLSTEPPGGGESFGAYALRTDMSLQTIFNTWKQFRLAERTIDHPPVTEQGKAEAERRRTDPKDWWNREERPQRAAKRDWWKTEERPQRAARSDWWKKPQPTRL